MTPLKGQQVYSADGTRWLGTVHNLPFPEGRSAAKLVRLRSLLGYTNFQAVFEWSRQLGGWLAL